MRVGGELLEDFSPEVTEYTVEVGHEVTSVQLSATPREEHAVVTLMGEGLPVEVPLQVGYNVQHLTVTAEDGRSSGSYSVAVVREASHEAVLGRLTLSHGRMMPPFHPNITSYSVDVNISRSAVGVEAEPTEEGSSVRARQRKRDGR